MQAQNHRISCSWFCSFFFLHSSCRDLLFCFLLAHVKARSSIPPRFPPSYMPYTLWCFSAWQWKIPYFYGGLVRWENHRSTWHKKWGIFQQGTWLISGGRRWTFPPVLKPWHWRRRWEQMEVIEPGFTRLELC